MNVNDHPSLEQLNDYVHGELPADQDAAVHAHLAGCSPCSEAHEIEARLGEILREHARATERDLPLGFAQRIVEAATSSQAAAPWWETLGRALRPGFAIPAVAVAALVVYLAVALPNQGTVHAASVDAASYIDNHAALATDMPFADGSLVPAELTSDEVEDGAR